MSLYLSLTLMDTDEDVMPYCNVAALPHQHAQSHSRRPVVTSSFIVIMLFPFIARARSLKGPTQVTLLMENLCIYQENLGNPVGTYFDRQILSLTIERFSDLPLYFPWRRRTEAFVALLDKPWRAAAWAPLHAQKCSVILQ